MALEPGLSTKTVIRSMSFGSRLDAREDRYTLSRFSRQAPGHLRFHERAALLIITVYALTVDELTPSARGLSTPRTNSERR